MGVPRGLAKATNYYNRIEAWNDWRKIAAQYPEIAKKYTPPDDAGWRLIDKCIAKVRKEVSDAR